jgi:asparagine synthase (glutamine-hydrolysing)
VPSSERVVDLLIAFGEPPSQLPVRPRCAPWVVRRRGDGWALCTSAPLVAHGGQASHERTVGGYEVVLLGDGQGFDAPATDLDGLVAQLPGHWLLFAHDTRTGAWSIRTDRHGTLHAAVLDGPVRAVSTSTTALEHLGSSRRTDWLGLAGFCTFGFFPADRTFVDDVHVVRPASVVDLDASGAVAARRRWWTWSHDPDPSVDDGEWVGRFAAAFDAALAPAREPGDTAVPISGGLDSRSTVAALTTAGVEPHGLVSYSYGFAARSIETRIADRIARARSLPFHRWTIDPYLSVLGHDAVAWTEGFQDVMHARQVAVVDRLSAVASRVVAAHWGDVWFDDMGLVGAQGITDAQLATKAVAKIEKRGGPWLAARLCGPHVDGDVAGALHDLVASELAALAHLEEPDFRLKAFKTDQWSWRWTLSSLRTFQASLGIVLPFYDTRVSDLFARIPTERVAARRLQVEYLVRRAPDLAAIEWQAEGRDLLHVGRRDPRALARRVVRRAVRELPGRAVPQRNWEVQLDDAATRRWAFEQFAQLERLDPAAVDVAGEAVARFEATPDPETAHAVTMLLTLALRAGLDDRVRPEAVRPLSAVPGPAPHPAPA